MSGRSFTMNNAPSVPGPFAHLASSLQQVAIVEFLFTHLEHAGPARGRLGNCPVEGRLRTENR